MSAANGEYGYQWPVPAEADVRRALLGAMGDMERGLPPKVEELLIIFASLHAARKESVR
jgi:hypothetical protein